MLDTKLNILEDYASIFATICQVWDSFPDKVKIIIPLFEHKINSFLHEAKNNLKK